MGFLLQFINLLALILSLAIIARALLSWFQPNPYNPIIRVLIDITEPILAPIRNLMPNMGGLDLSPLIALVLINVIQQILFQVLRG